MEYGSTSLREKFLSFFKEKGHIVIPSASLVPENDPSVLFTTAGMQQFKRYYSEPEQAPAGRVTTVQKCVRTGDIDEVGDNTHLTFFEMLGNFSFGYPDKEGSYFKEEAIKLAWEFLTEVLKIDKSRIHATYFKGENGVVEDLESLKILENITGLEKIEPQGFGDNFWSLGAENSPGGPTVEFYVDGVEIWNLVFNEYLFKDGGYHLSKYKGVDTGMGLERLLVALNNTDDVYQTDLFESPHNILQKLGAKEDLVSERIILDHIKAAVFIINDGVVPSNKDRGYVLRRLIRRAIVKGHQIGVTENFTTKLAKQYFNIYNKVFKLDINQIITELQKEEIKFRQTLSVGLKLIDSNKEINGKILFDLFQSYGLPMEIAIEEAKHREIKISNLAIEQFNNLMQQHQELSRTASAGMFKGGLADGGEMVTKYHTATHLLLAALRQVLGDKVVQRGANITEERIRFDFSHLEKMTPEQIAQVEAIVNEKIREDLPVTMAEMTVEEAKNSGAMGVFESKYGEQVKVYTIGKQNGDSPKVGLDSFGVAKRGDNFSREICGGPHVTHTGELGHFKITKEESSSAGVRRIKAILN